MKVAIPVADDLMCSHFTGVCGDDPEAVARSFASGHLVTGASSCEN